jgi:imidazolonepropionase-like amidohydrolase
MRKYSLLLILAFCTTPAYAQTYITHATLVNVNTSKTDPDQTIVIENDRITNTGPSKKIKIPANAKVIDATGQYIMPGMTDAHIHFFQTGGLYTRPDGLNLNKVYPYEKDQQWAKDHLGDLMARYLACGITTVIDVGGPFSNYAIRDKANTDSSSVTAWVTGPLISTFLPPNLDKNDPPIVKINTPEEARELVKKQLPYKPDFIKIWYIVLPGQSAESTLPIVQAAIDESHAHGLKVAVHATEYETAKLAVTAGADILVHSVDDKVLDNGMLELLKAKKTVYIPTLLVSENYRRTFTQQFNFSAHDFAYADPFMLGTLMDLKHIPYPVDYKVARTRFRVPSEKDSLMLVNLKLAEQAGILIVSGTDAGNIATLHASSFLPELLAMQRAGLSNWEIIRSSTINAAKGFGKDKDYGSIDKGKIADLLLLEKDPTTDINALADIHTVIHRGKTFYPHQLLAVTPEILVQQQLNAYNAHDIEAFLQPYSDSVALYDQASGKLLMKGKDQVRLRYTDMFNKLTELHCELKSRMVVGNTIIDHEKLTGMKSTPVEVAAVYTIDKGKIVKVYFIR